MLNRKLPISINENDNDEIVVIDPHASYVIEGWHFDVERVFNNATNDSLGMVLLKLIEAEIAPF